MQERLCATRIFRFILSTLHRYARNKGGEIIATHKPVNPTELRDHLANERTLLSWIRTSITMAGLGFVVAKFGILLREVGGSHVHPLTSKAGAVVGVALVIAGMAMAGLATLRFAQTRRDIDAGVVRFSPTLDIALALLFGIASVVLAIYIIGTA